MYFFNNSLHRGYIGGNIIIPNTIYMVKNFNTFILDHIRSKIDNIELILILNRMFSPITGNDTSYPYNCEEYSNFSFSNLNHDGNIFVNNNTFDIETFKSLYINYKFSTNDIVVLSMDIEYIEQIEKGNV